MSLSYQPFKDYLIVKQTKFPEKIGSLIIPQKILESLPVGEVIVCGPDVKSVAVGDRIFWNGRGHGLPFADEMVMAVKEEDLICKVEGEESELIVVGAGNTRLKLN